MEKKKNIIKVYALIIDVVAVIAFIICVSVLVSGIIDRSKPLSASWSSQYMSSFENYKMEKMKDVKQDQAYIPSDEELKDMYESEKEERMNTILHESNKAIYVSSLIILISIALFITHYKLLKKQDNQD